MQQWKRAVLAGSAAASAIMFLKKKRAAGILLAGVGLATLASEYPEKFAQIRAELPDYLERGTNFLDIVSRLGERIASAARKSSSDWYDSLLRG